MSEEIYRHSSYTINMFDYEWYYTNIASFLSIFVVLIICYSILNLYYVKKNKLELKITQLLGVLILARFLSSQIYQLYFGIWDPSHSLPFHLCGISELASGLLLIKYNQSIYEFLLLLGAPGAIWSFLTPQINLLEQGAGFYNPTFMYVNYFISHAAIIFTPLYLTFILSKRPRPLSYFKVFINSNIILVPLASIVNIIIYYSFENYKSVNYMYLMARPEAENPFIIGGWPWYILSIEIVGFLHMILIYYLFVSIKSIKRNVVLKRGVA